MKGVKEVQKQEPEEKIEKELSIEEQADEEISKEMFGEDEPEVIDFGL